MISRCAKRNEGRTTQRGQQQMQREQTKVSREALLTVKKIGLSF